MPSTQDLYRVDILLTRYDTMDTVRTDRYLKPCASDAINHQIVQIKIRSINRLKNILTNGQKKIKLGPAKMLTHLSILRIVKLMFSQF